MATKSHTNLDFQGNKIIDATFVVATLSGASVNVNWKTAEVFLYTLSANSTIADSNLQAGMTKEIRVVGNGYTLTLPSYWQIVGNGTYDPNGVNVFTITCYNATASSEVVEVSIVTR